MPGAGRVGDDGEGESCPPQLPAPPLRQTSQSTGESKGPAGMPKEMKEPLLGGGKGPGDQWTGLQTGSDTPPAKRPMLASAFCAKQDQEMRTMGPRPRESVEPDWVALNMLKAVPRNKGSKGEGVREGDRGRVKGKGGARLGCFIPMDRELPRYDPRDRAMFTRLFNESPEELRRYIAFHFLRMPFAGARELGRVLFCNYGALIVEVCHLFECGDLEAVRGKVRREYCLPGGCML